MKIHMVLLKPKDHAPGMHRLLKWDALRAVPDGNGGFQKRITSNGLLCEIDDADLDEAKTFCDVEIIASKEK